MVDHVRIVVYLPFGRDQQLHRVTQGYGEGDHGPPNGTAFSDHLFYSIDLSADFGTSILAQLEFGHFRSRRGYRPKISATNAAGSVCC